MRNYKASDVDSYLKEIDKKARIKLEEIRKIIKATVPKAEEKISWGIPFYWYHGALAGMSVFKNHVGFGFAAPFGNDIRKALENKGYKTGSKTVQIKFDQQVPTEKLQQILKVQVKINETKKISPDK